ncbi:MAG: glycosyltransferase family 4 protein [Rikenellaceae bacterium]
MVMRGKEFNICSIGRPCYQKNTKFLIEIAKSVVERIPSIKFYLLGVGYYSPDLDEVKVLIDKYSLCENFELVEWLPQHEIFDYIDQADIYVSTSLYEGLPLSVIEVMSMSRPIIASDVVGNRDCVFEGENGYLLPFDKEQFVAKIIELYNDDKRREGMGRRSRELFLEHFHIETQADKLKQIYKDIANK